MYNECRGCKKYIDMPTVCDLGHLPLANSFLSEQDLQVAIPTYPLHVVVCPECRLVQLPPVVDPDDMFTANYPYFSGQSVQWGIHCKKLADKCIERFQLGATSRVLDIGSNDGTALRRFRGRGVPAIGIEPSRAVAQHALMEGLPTIIEWWGRDTASKLANTKGIPTGKNWKADLVLASNVLAHVPDLHDFLDGIYTILAPGGVAVFEFPNVHTMIQDGQFDQIYAEHHCYFGLNSINRALNYCNLCLFDYETIPVHGGSYRIYVKKHSDSREWDQQFMKSALDAEPQSMEYYTDFEAVPRLVKHHANGVLLRRGGGKIVGYGAPAKATTFLNYCGIGPGEIEYLVDSTPSKQGKYIPGVHIPIYHPDFLAKDKPDTVVVMAWNWFDEIAPKIREVLPEAEIITLNGCGLP
jgi:SAM-dependent methyltransferase